MLSFLFRKQDGSRESSGGKQPSHARPESLNGEETSRSDPGLDWFHSISSPAEGNSTFLTSPIHSSTQHHTADTPCPGVLPSNSGPAHAEVSAWEKLADKDSNSVVQKISKKLRVKRLKEMNAEHLENERTNAVDERVKTLSTHELPCHSTPMADRKRPAKRKAPSFSPPETEQAESENLQVDLSNFTFRPRARMAHTDRASGSNPAPKMDERGCRIGTARKKKNAKEKTQNQRSEQPAEGSSTCKKLRVRVQAEVREIPADKPQESEGTADDTELKRQQLVHSLSSEPSNERVSAVQPPQPKPRVASSTLAKLSAFSFVPSPEEKPSQNPTAAPTQENNTTPVSKDGVMEKDGSAAESAHTNTRTTAEKKSSKNSSAQTRQKTSRPHRSTETCEEQSESSRKRKCFESNSARPGGLFSGLSFFSSSIVDDEALDVDWEEESRKKV